jgi:hypothetical protein
LKLLALLGALVVLPLLAGGGLFLLDDDLNESERTEQPVLSSPTPRTVTDERQMRIVASALAGPEIGAGTARGTITGVVLQPGVVMEQSAVLFQVDGIDRVGFASSIPFYRPIASSADGADVSELHRLLVLSGVLAAAPANPRLATFATGQAIGDFAESIGAPRTTTFDPAWVFLPASGLVAEAVNLGQQAPAQGTVIITTPGRATSARLASPIGTADLAPVSSTSLLSMASSSPSTRPRTIADATCRASAARRKRTRRHPRSPAARRRCSAGDPLRP